MFFLARRFALLKAEIIRGWYEIPYLYTTIGIVAFSGVGVVYKAMNLKTLEDTVMRHKEHYIVVRPDDARLKKYPREFITDIDLVKKYEASQN